MNMYMLRGRIKMSRGEEAIEAGGGMQYDVLLR